MTRRALGLVLLAVVLLVAACGLPEDSSPRAIPRDDVPPELEVEASTSVPPSGASSTQLLYFVRTGETPGLSPVEREISENPDGPIKGVLDALLASPESEENLTNIPSRVELLDWSLENGTLTLDLSDEFAENTGTGETLQLAVAQIVATVTEFDEVDAVRFETEGEAREVPTNEGTSPLVSRCDYADFFDPPLDDCP